MSPEDYSDIYTSGLNALQQELLEYTLAHHPKAHMCSGHVQGQLLRQISMMLQPHRILEIGTFTGFSALCLADGLHEGGIFYTLELNEAEAAGARSYFERCEKKSQIKSLTGNASDIIPTLDELFDLVFIDADKTGYTNYYEQVLPKMRSGGIILADNVLFHGEVLQENITGKSAKAIATFNEHVRKDNRVEHVLMTVRDGLMLIRKK